MFLISSTTDLLNKVGARVRNGFADPGPDPGPSPDPGGHGTISKCEPPASVCA